MPGPAGLPSSTRNLMARIECGSLEAALKLTCLYRPDDINDLVLFVCPTDPPSTVVFDVLADAYALYQLEAA